MNLVDKITKDQIRTDLPEFRVGDTVIVGYKIKEGDKERIQDFEGIVIALKNGGVGRNFIVRKLSQGIGVERTFVLNSPRIAYVTVVRKGMVRRSRLNYLRTLVSQPRIKERRDKSDSEPKAA